MASEISMVFHFSLPAIQLISLQISILDTKTLQQLSLIPSYIGIMLLVWVQQTEFDTLILFS